VSGIYWLASYPKSGNTWLRIFLTNYWRDGDEPADINQLDNSPIASARGVFDELSGVEASDLTPDEIDLYRPAVYSTMAARSKTPLFLKVHDAYTTNSAGKPILAPDATFGAIYLLRNPLDIAVSYAHHAGTTVEEMVERLCRPMHTLNKSLSKLHNQLRQKLLSWSDHVLSWVDAPPFPVHPVRYEDMVHQPEATFTGIVRFLGISVVQARVRKALEFSDFERLKTQEATIGFNERAPKAKNFFRAGRTGSWRNVLTEAQVAALISTHQDVMRRFGYLNADNTPIY